MGREDVERALRAMDDDDIRDRLAQGDFEAVSGLDLTDEERTLVRDAAEDYPEVAGFTFARWNLISSWPSKTTGPEPSAPPTPDKYLLAVNYAVGD